MLHFQTVTLNVSVLRVFVKILLVYAEGWLRHLQAVEPRTHSVQQNCIMELSNNSEVWCNILHQVMFFSIENCTENLFMGEILAWKCIKLILKQRLISGYFLYKCIIPNSITECSARNLAKKNCIQLFVFYKKVGPCSLEYKQGNE